MGGSAQQKLHAEGTEKVWVKKSRRKKVTRLNTAMYNILTLLRHGQIQ